MQGAQLGGRRGAELVSQEAPEPVVRLKRLGVIAARRVRAHEERVPGLPEGRQLHELPRGELGARGPLVTQREARAAEQLERLEPRLLLHAAVLLDPGRVERGHEGGLVDVERGLRVRARPLGIAPRRRPGLGERRGRGLHVDLGAGRKLEAQLAAALKQLRAERAPQRRQQRAEGGAGVARRARGPERVHQLVARHLPVAVQDQVGEQGAAEPPGQAALHAPAVDLEAQLAPEVNPDRTPIFLGRGQFGEDRPRGRRRPS